MPEIRPLDVGREHEPMLTLDTLKTLGSQQRTTSEVS